MSARETESITTSYCITNPSDNNISCITRIVHNDGNRLKIKNLFF